MSERHFSWQVPQNFVKFWEIGGARNVVFFKDRTSKVSEAEGARWRFYPRIMLESSYIGGSNVRISRSNLELGISWQAQYLVSVQGDFTCRSRQIMSVILRGRRSICWSWRLTLVAPHCEWRFLCEADQSRDFFRVAGAVWLFVAGAAFLNFGR